jgi:hypothetical protein
MRRTYYSEGYLNVSVLGDRAAFNVERCDSLSIQVDGVSATALSSGVLTVKVSNNGDKWYAYPIATTMSAEGITDALEVAAYRYVALEVTTVQSGVGVKVTGYAEGMSDPDNQYSNIAASVNFGNTAGGVPSGGSGAIGPVS